MGAPEIANAWLRAGVIGLGDSLVENIKTMRGAQMGASMTLIRTPMLSQLDQVVELTNVSFNTEIKVIRKLSETAKRLNRIHAIILMVELGDLREGIMPPLIEKTVRSVLRLPNKIGRASCRERV